MISSRMSAPNAVKTSAPEPHFMGIPKELRLMIYEFLFSELARRPNSPPVKYHFCDKTCEITTNAGRFLGHRRMAGLTSILRTCRKVHEEAITSLYDSANIPRIIVGLRPASASLDLPCAAGNLLAHAKRLKLNISISFPCQSTQQSGKARPPVAATTTRRASWNGWPSVGTKDSTTEAPRPSTRTRRKTWAGPVPTRACVVTYLRRLEALLHAFKYGKKLTHLDIYIENTERRLNAQSIDTILRHMEARLRVGTKCLLMLHLCPSVRTLVTDLQIARFLDEIQQ